VVLDWFVTRVAFGAAVSFRHLAVQATEADTVCHGS